MTNTRCTFITDEQAIQLDYFGRHFSDRVGHRGRPFQLKHDSRFDGLLPNIRDVAVRLFDKQHLNIQWHPYIGHGRSSQACCVNFLMPLADKPELLSRWIGHVIGTEPREMLPVEKAMAGDHRFVAFEYTGPNDKDFLGEANGGVPGRGAHATAADAAVAWVDADGRRQLLLIEWKYSEQYRGHRLSPDSSGKRLTRYADMAFAPNGPIRADLGLTLTDFFFEPFYQLLRQQMLAWQIERHADFDVVRVLHLSPGGNRALHLITAPKLQVVDGVAHDDAFDAYRSTLVEPSAFLNVPTERAFAPLACWPEASWCETLVERYPSLCTSRGDAIGQSS